VAKLLQTNLPFATGPNVTAETFNQLVRTLEINLGSIDPDNTLQLTTAERDELNFNIGQIIYNTTTTTLQYWDGTNFQNISALGAVNLNVSDGSATIGINLGTQTLSLIGGTGITSNASGTSVTFAIDNTVATLTGTQTLTNKTLTSPVLNGTLSGSAFKDEDNMASNSATAVASQQSIKAYVDSQVGTVDTLAEILANGNTTGGTDIAVSANDDITFTDSSKALFGASSDLQIYHDSSNSYIRDIGTGDLFLAATNLRLTNGGVTATYLQGTDGGAVDIRYNNSIKLATTNIGIDVTGEIEVGDSHKIGDDGFDNLALISSSGENLVLGSANDLYFNTNATSLSSTGNARMYVSGTNGYVGIGTIVPAANLHVESSAPEFRLSQSGTAVVRLRTSGDNYINTGQKLGLGTNSPDTKLDLTTGGVAGLILNQDTSNSSVSSRLFFKDQTRTNAIVNVNGNLELRTGATIGVSSGTKRLVVNGNGNVCIGNNAAPSRQLTVYNTSAAAVLAITTSTSNFAQIALGDTDDDNYAQIVLDNSNNKLQIQNGGGSGIINRGITLDSSENIGIATSSPATKLDVNGTSTFRDDVTFTGASANIIYDSSTNNLEFQDTAKASFGTGNDLLIYHDSESVIEDVGTNGLIIKTDGPNISIDGGSEVMGKFIKDGAVELYYDNNKRFETTSIGVNIPNQLVVQGTTTFNDDAIFTNDALFGDNDKAIFGAGSDLQIYHDSSNSYINEVGTGDLIIKGGNDILFQDAVGNTLANMNQSNSVELYFGGSKKFETSSAGITVTGTITSGAITSSGLVNADSLEVQNDSTFNGDLDASGQSVNAANFGIGTVATVGSSSATTSATTQVAVDTVSKAAFRTVKYLVQITNSTDNEYHATEILVTHDGTTPSMTEYATIFTGTAEEATFSADISGSNLRLLATPASTDSMTFKITRTGIKV